MKDILIIETIVVGSMETNCYIYGTSKTNEVIIIDPGDEYERIEALIKKNRYKPKFIVITHGHLDHIGAVDKFDLPVYVHDLDKDCFNNPLKNLSSLFNFNKTFNVDARTFKNNDIIKIDTIALEVIHTPGHTPGSICLKAPDLIFTGDTLFYEGIGRTDFPGASQGEIMKSIKNKLLKLGDNMTIYPGHGPCSTIGNERINNPFLSAFTEEHPDVSSGWM